MKKIIPAVLAALLMLSSAVRANAAGEGILSRNYSDGIYSAYLKLNDECSDFPDVRADGMKTEIIGFGRTGEACDIYTTFLAERKALEGEGKEVFSGILREFMALAGENESFSLVTCGTDGITTVSDYTKNQMLILNAAEKTEAEPESADLGAVLEEWYSSSEAHDAFERVIVFSSGQSAGSPDISRCEFKKRVVPSYFVVTDGNTFFSSSPDDIKGCMGYCAVSPGSDYQRAASLAADMSDIYFLSTRLSDEIIGNGGEKRISILFENELHSAAFEECIDTGDYRYVSAEKSLNRLKIILAAVSLGAFVLLALLVIVLRKRKNDVKTQPSEDTPHFTVPLHRKNERNGTVFSSLSTRILFRESTEKKILLTDLDNPEHIIEISSLRETTIGRNQSLSDVVIYNERSVSQKHCRIYCRKSRVYVEDLGSLNHTYVDSEQVNEETELFSGSVLKIGRVSFRVTIE